MTWTFGKWPIYFGNGFDAWAWVKYLRNGLTMFEMA